MSDWNSRALQEVCGSFIGLTTIFVGLRFYARTTHGLNLRADDWIMLAAWIGFVAVSATVIYGTSVYWFGYSLPEIPPQDLALMAGAAAKAPIGLMQVEMPMFACTKLSAIFLYRRIFDVPGPGSMLFRSIIWASVAMIIAWTVALMIAIGFACGTHLQDITDWNVYAQYCNLAASSWPFVISDFIIDVWVVALPIPWILRLHMSPKKKIGVIGVFLTAFIGLGASIARLIAWANMEYNERHDPKSIDAMKMGSMTYFFDILEAGATIVAINLPVVAPLLFLASTKLRTNISSLVRSRKVLTSRSTSSAARSDSLEDHKSSNGSEDGSVEFVDTERVRSKEQQHASTLV